jgi:UDP:flavonoid glycosyltransferase YjiC (YdhE family)
MRIGIITIGSRGDVQPYIALGTAFKRAGYEVRLLTHGAFADAARAEGLEFADLGVDPRAVMEQVMQEAGLAQDARRIALFRQMAFMRQELRIAQPLLQDGVQRAWRLLRMWMPWC